MSSMRIRWSLWHITGSERRFMVRWMATSPSRCVRRQPTTAVAGQRSAWTAIDCPLPVRPSGLGPANGSAAEDPARAQGCSHQPGVCVVRQPAVQRQHRWQHWRVDRQGRAAAGGQPQLAGAAPGKGVLLARGCSWPGAVLLARGCSWQGVLLARGCSWQGAAPGKGLLLSASCDTPAACSAGWGSTG